MMKSIFLSSLFTLFLLPAFASENFCIRCEKVKEYHSQNPNDYEYYEDYLQAVKEGKVKKIDAEKVMKEINEEQSSDTGPLFKTDKKGHNRSIPLRKIDKKDKVKKTVVSRTRYWPFKKSPRVEG